MKWHFTLTLKTPRKRRCLLDYPRELRGTPNNKYGGHKTGHLCGFRGSTFGPTGPVRQYTPEEIREYERRMNDK